MLLWASAHCSTVSQREGGRGGEGWDTKAAVDMKRGTHAKWTTKYYAWHEQRTYSSCCDGGGDFDMHVRVYADFWVLSSKAQQRHLKLETVSLWAQAAWHEQKHELKWKETCSLAAQWTQSRLIWKHNRLLSFYTLLRKTNYAHPTCYCLFKSSCQFFLSFFFHENNCSPNNNELSAVSHMDSVSLLIHALHLQPHWIIHKHLTTSQISTSSQQCSWVIFVALCFI